MCKGEDEESEKTEKRDREMEKGRGRRGDSLNLAFTCAWQTRNADDTGIVLSLVLSVRSRGSRILLVGRLLQRLSFACCHDEDIDLTPRYTRIAREQRVRVRKRLRTSRCWNDIPRGPTNGYGSCKLNIYSVAILFHWRFLQPSFQFSLTLEFSYRERERDTAN